MKIIKAYLLLWKCRFKLWRLDVIAKRKNKRLKETQENLEKLLRLYLSNWDRAEKCFPKNGWSSSGKWATYYTTWRDNTFRNSYRRY